MRPLKVYGGVGLGKAYQLEEKDIVIDKKKLNQEDVQHELDKFERVRKTVLDELAQIVLKAKETIGEEESLIFEAHREILDDPEFIGGIKQKISKSLYCSEWAVDETRSMFLEIFSHIEDVYIRERSKDIDDVSQRLLCKLLNVNDLDLGSITEDVIVFANDLSPSQTVGLNHHIKGIVLQAGSVTSHAAIVAKAKGIPTLVGVAECMMLAKDKEFVILDADNGKVFASPDEEILNQYHMIYKEQLQEALRLRDLKEQEAITLDGRRIKLYGNAGSAMEANLISEQGGEGIGLLRTEFIYMQSKKWPTEEEQVKAYKEICSKVNGEVIIRTLDIGGDKNLPYHTFEEEMNPFLGLRAIRFCLKHPDIFKVQLRAILRTSGECDVAVMFPMISQVEEVRSAKAYLKEAMAELEKENIPFNPHIKIGIMIEIPAAVIGADLLIKEVDFVSMGTNDLCQYTLAIDRMNSQVAYLYQPLHPSILRMVDITVKSAQQKQAEVGVCGEMAGDPKTALALVGLGVDELSMSASMIPKVKEAIRKRRYNELSEVSQKLCTMDTIEEIEKYIQEVF